MIKVSELLNSKIHPLIHGGLISRIIESKNNEFFATVSAYQKSRKIENYDFDEYSKEYLRTLNLITNSDNWISYERYKQSNLNQLFLFTGKEKAIFIIENDLKITKNSFFNKLFAKLFNDCEWFNEYKNNENKKFFIRGFCELRGSIDTKLKFLSLDYFYDNTFELNKARLLNENLFVPYFFVNINFRQLQKQFLEKTNKRNTQLRINLEWYIKEIGLINDYKFQISKNLYDGNYKFYKYNYVNYLETPCSSNNKSTSFINRLNFFSMNIFNKKLEKRDIDLLRKELGFDLNKKEIKTFSRNKDLVYLIRMYNEDNCGSCKSKYNILDRTFIHKKTNRPYFEIHHNISLGNNNELDHEDNLVKLCPVCHKALKQGLAIESHQKDIIKNILLNNNKVYDFAKHFFDTNDEDIVIEKIYLSLK